MNEYHSLFRHTHNYLLAHQLMEPGGSIVAAVSGGQDSCVMLHILHMLSSKLGFSLTVAHFDHQLRPESAAEQQFVEKLAATYGLPFYSGRADVRTLAKGKNLEDTARRVRYDFLRKTMLEIGATKIATAHHAQDQAETVLLHLLRGSGLEGLAAMAPREGDIIRPLLSALPEQIKAYRLAYGLSFCTDASNDDPRYLRNFIRLNLLPQLLQLNPRLLQTLCATADICYEDNYLLTAWAKVALDELWLKDDGAIAPGLFALPPALQRRIVRLAFMQISGEELSFAQTEATRALKEEQSVSLSGGWLIYRRGALFISREKSALPEHRQSVPLKIEATWQTLADWGWEYLGAQVLDAPSFAAKDEYCISLPDTLLPNLYFRTRRAGDAVPSLGKSERRKVKDIFIDAKIPPYLRAGWPLLIVGEEIIWLPGLYKREYKQEKSTVKIFARRIGL